MLLARAGCFSVPTGIENTPLRPALTKPPTTGNIRVPRSIHCSCPGRNTMRRMSTLLAAALSAGALGLHPPAQAADEMSLARLDCGTPQAPTPVNQRFSDTYSYGDLKLQFVYSCYIIKHGDQYLLWDTGHAMTTPNVAPKVSVVDQLAKIELKPE